MAWITLDYYDGTRSKAKKIDLDGFGMSEMIFLLMNRDVCGFTVTKENALKGLIDKRKVEDAK